MLGLASENGQKRVKGERVEIIRELSHTTKRNEGPALQAVGNPVRMHKVGGSSYRPRRRGREDGAGTGTGADRDARCRTLIRW